MSLDVNTGKVLQLDYSSGACPHGYFLLHLSQSWLNEPGDDPFDDLDRVLRELMKCGASCIFRPAVACL